MKIYFKRFRIIVLAMAITFALPIRAGAIGNVSALQGYEAIDDHLVVYLATLEAEPPEAKQLSFTLSGVPLQVTSVEQTQDDPVTYYCLVDISGSLNMDQYQMEQDVLRAIADQLSQGDKMVIAAIGNTLTATGYLSEPDEIRAAIDGLERTGEDTNLYQGIVDGLRDLSTSSEATSRKCLVVLSDGEDYYYGSENDSTVKGRADKAVVDSRIPVYTVAAMNSARAHETSRQELAKLLGSFAQQSTGGKHFNPVLEDMDGAAAGGEIVGDMKNDLRVALDLSGFQSERDLPELEMRYEGMNNAVYEDSLTISAADLPVVTEPTTTDPEESAPVDEPQGEGETPEHNDPTTDDGSQEGQEPSGETDGTSGSEFDWKTMLWIAISILVLAVLLTVLLARRKKKNQAAEEAAQVEQSAQEEAAAVDPLPYTDMAEPFDGQPKPVSPPPGRPVLFSAVGDNQVNILLHIPENRELILGRDDRADMIFNADDPKLSGRHFGLVLEDGVLRVWDAGSTNGISVNDVPVQPGVVVPLYSGQTLWAGSYRYRITIEG